MSSRTVEVERLFANRRGRASLRESSRSSASCAPPLPIPRRLCGKYFNPCPQCHFCETNLIQKKTASNQASRVQYSLNSIGSEEPSAHSLPRVAIARSRVRDPVPLVRRDCPRDATRLLPVPRQAAGRPKCGPHLLHDCRVGGEAVDECGPHRDRAIAVSRAYRRAVRAGHGDVTAT